MFLALPLLIFTLGLFTLVINALLLHVVGLLLAPYFQVDTFWLRISGRAHHQHRFHRAEHHDRQGARVIKFSAVRRRRQKNPDDDDDKPVIDVLIE